MLTRIARRRLDIPAAVNRTVFGASTPAVGLDVPLPGHAAPTQAEYASAPSAEETVTKLPSGLTVVTSENSFPIATVGLATLSGSRFESEASSGSSFLLSRLAFASRGSRSQLSLTRAMGLLGVSATSSAGREVAYAHASSAREFVPFLVGDVLGPLVTEAGRVDAWEVADLVKSYGEAAAADRQNANIDVVDLVHEAAFHRNTLGMPLAPEEGSLSGLSPAVIADFAQTHVTPDRSVIVAHGVDNAEFVDLVQQHLEANGFGSGTAGAAAAGSSTSAAAGKSPTAVRPAYTGGDKRVHSETAPSASVAVAFETPGGWSNQKDAVALCVLQSLMGGGGSFSAGGPGKGLHTRLYRNVLNRKAFVDGIQTFASIHSDSGVFGIFGTAAPQSINDVASTIAGEFALLASQGVSDAELARAKSMLAAQVLRSSDARTTSVEDSARHVLMMGAPESAAAQVAKIEAVTAADIKRLATAMVGSGKASVAASGNLNHLASFDSIVSQLK